MQNDSSHQLARDPSVRQAPVRERILRAASRLFYERGVQAVGVDAIVDAAGVAKMSLYRHFPSKAELVRAALEHDDERLLEGYRRMLERGGEVPLDRLRALFGGLEKMTQDAEFRGCAFLNAGLALPDHEHPAHEAVRRHKGGLRSLLRAEAERAGHPQPERAADALVVLVEGVLVSGALRPETHPAQAAAPLAAAVLRADV